MDESNVNVINILLGRFFFFIFVKCRIDIRIDFNKFCEKSSSFSLFIRSQKLFWKDISFQLYTMFEIDTKNILTAFYNLFSIFNRIQKVTLMMFNAALHKTLVFFSFFSFFFFSSSQDFTTEIVSDSRNSDECTSKICKISY